MFRLRRVFGADNLLRLQQQLLQLQSKLLLLLLQLQSHKLLSPNLFSKRNRP
jgi:hypothetical protein